MNIKGIYIFKSDSGITLFSKRILDIQEDLFNAFLSALKEFFNSLSLGGLSSFATEDYIFYLASWNNVSATLVVDQDEKSDKYFNIAYDLCSQFYNKFEKYVNSETALFIPNVDQFEQKVEEILSYSEVKIEKQQELIRLYKLSKSSELVPFEFINEHQLFNQDLFVAVNMVMKQIFVIENAESSVSARLLYLINKAVTNLNQIEFKSEFSVSNISDIWDFERLIGQITHILNKESIIIKTP